MSWKVSRIIKRIWVFCIGQKVSISTCRWFLPEVSVGLDWIQRPLRFQSRRSKGRWLGGFVKGVQTSPLGLDSVARAWLCWWKEQRPAVLSKLESVSEMFGWKGKYSAYWIYTATEQDVFCFVQLGMWKARSSLWCFLCAQTKGERSLKLALCRGWF